MMARRVAPQSASNFEKADKRIEKIMQLERWNKLHFWPRAFSFLPAIVVPLSQQA
jgi:hypothetical protein